MGNPTRPQLTRTIDAEEFLRYYWLKEELTEFCRGTGLVTYGSKEEIATRIVQFLNGEIPSNTDIPQYPRRRKAIDAQPSLDTIITKNYTNNQVNRAFFQSVIGPEFHFTTRFMSFCKNNAGKTFRDAVDEWLLEREERKSGTYQPEIGSQFEYNQFIRDYFREHPGKSMKEAVEAWWRWRGVDLGRPGV